MGRRGHPRSALLWTAVDTLLVATLAAVVAFPLAARISASDAGISPVPAAAPAPSRAAHAPPLRDVPRFVGARPREQVLADVHALGTALDSAFGRLAGEAGHRLYATVRNENARVVPDSDKPFPYPFRYPLVDSLLDRVLARPLAGARADSANDLAGLLMLASARFPRVFPNAAPVAFSCSTEPEAVARARRSSISRSWSRPTRAHATT